MKCPTGPFAGLLLADYGATVLRIDRPHPCAHTSSPPAATNDRLTRGKSSIALDFKSSASLSILLSLIPIVDVLIDPFRPGVLEGLGLAPERLLKLNSRLVLARLSGFRRDGKYADMAGHDINYLAVAGVLSMLGPASSLPHAPGNILADFAGGGTMCVLGVLLALLSRATTGRGQVVEANMVDGSAYLTTMPRLAMKTPLWDRPRGQNLLDGACPYYSVYETKDRGAMAVGALEPKFFARLIQGLDLERQVENVGKRDDRKTWPQIRKLFEARFQEKTRKEWETIFNGTDACCTPVLTQAELESSGFKQMVPVKLTDTPGKNIRAADGGWSSEGLAPGFGGEDILAQWTGWHRGRDFELDDGKLVKCNISKL